MLPSENDKLIPACQQESRSGVSFNSFLKILDLKYISNMLKKVYVDSMFVCRKYQSVFSVLGQNMLKIKNKNKESKNIQKEECKRSKEKKKEMKKKKCYCYRKRGLKLQLVSLG